VEFIAIEQDINTLKISVRNAVGLLAVTNMATGRSLYIYLFVIRVLRTVSGSDWVDKFVYRGALCCIYCALNIVRVANESEMRGAHGTPGTEEKYVYECVRGSLKKEITTKT
jgi:hypothetical protein